MNSGDIILFRSLDKVLPIFIPDVRADATLQPSHLSRLETRNSVGHPEPGFLSPLGLEPRIFQMLK